MGAIATKPIGNVPAGTQGGPQIITDQSLVQKANQINQQIEKLKKGLP